MKTVSIAKLTALLLVMILVFTAIPFSTFANSSSDMKTTDNLSLRTAPSTSASRILVIPRNTVVSVSGKEGVWYKVTYGGKTGWSHGDWLRAVTTTTAAPAPTTTTVKAAPTTTTTTSTTHMTTTANLSMRTGPSTSNSRILVIPSGKSVPVSGTSGVWKKVTYGGKTGWAHSSYLKASTTTVAAPAPAPAPTPAPAPAPAKTTTTTTTGTKMQTTANLSMRTGPSTSYSRILVIPNGGQVTATETSGVWKKINYNGTVGWAHSSYLKTVTTQVVESAVETKTTTTAATKTNGYAISYTAANQGQKEIFASTNNYRAAAGKSKLTYSAGLSAVAQSWAQKMAANKTIAHSPKGDIFGNWQATGENVALFYEKVGGEKLVNAWKNSAGHKVNLDYGYTHIGVGYYVDGNGYTWAVQIFAKYSYGIGSDVAPWIH